MSGDVVSAMELEKEYNSKEREVMLYECDFIVDNLDSYMSALLLEVFMIENKVNKDSIIDVYESFSNRIKVSDVGKNIADLLSQFEDPIEVGEIAPDFTAPSIDGPNITLSNVLLDNKVTLLDFWAAWCRPCRIENPNLVRLHKKYKDAGYDGVECANIGMDAEEFADYIEELGLEYVAMVFCDTEQAFEEQLSELINRKPILINCHPGRDFWDFNRGCEFFKNIF